MHMVVVVCVCVVAPTLGLRQACKGEGAPSLASSLPFRKWAGCTREGEKQNRNKLAPSYSCES